MELLKKLIGTQSETGQLSGTPVEVSIEAEIGALATLNRLPSMMDCPTDGSVGSSLRRES